MTLTDLDRKTAALEMLRAHWESRLLARVRPKVADAHAHALKALTDALKSRPDGRASILQLNRSPSLVAARERLNELWAWLAGPSEVSQKGKVRDFREAAYREACKLWFPLIPAHLRSRGEHEPTVQHIRQIRAAAIHGYDPRKVLEGPILTAQRTLKAALEQAGRKSTPGRVEDDLLSAWESRVSASLQQSVITLLNDSVEYADRLAGRELIHPDHLVDSE